MFKNAIIYQCFTDKPDADALNVAVLGHAAREPSPREKKRDGWAPLPTSDGTQYCYNAGGAGITLLNLERQWRDLKPRVVNGEVDKRAEALRQDRGRPASRSERTIIKEQVYEEFLPRAFVLRHQFRVAWVSIPAAGVNLIVVDASARKDAETAIDLLRLTLGSLKVVPLRPGEDAVTTPDAVLTNAVRHSGTLRIGVGLGDSCKMYAPDLKSQKITFKATGLDTEEVAEALAAGYHVENVELVFERQLTAVLNDALELKRIRYADETTEGMESAEDWLASCIIGVNAIVSTVADVLAMHAPRQ